MEQVEQILYLPPPGNVPSQCAAKVLAWVAELPPLKKTKKNNKNEIFRRKKFISKENRLIVHFFKSLSVSEPKISNFRDAVPVRQWYCRMFALW